MADNPEFFRARAAEERANAAAATLDNVRVRCERAARTWTEMADRATRTNAARAEREARPADCPPPDAPDRLAGADQREPLG